MRFIDLVGLALSALLRNKLRTVLTVLGILFGTFVLATSVAACLGVQETILGEYARHGELREIGVRAKREPGEEDIPPGLLPVKGEMSQERRQRLREEILRRAQARTHRQPAKPLTKAVITELATLPHVSTIRPLHSAFLRASLDPRGKTASGYSLAVPPDDSSLRQRLVAGRFLESGETGSIVVSEYLLYELGVADDSAVTAVLGQRLRVSTRFQGPNPLSLLSMLGRDTEVSRVQEETVARVVKKLPDILKHAGLPPEEERVMLELLQRKAKEDKTPPPPLYSEEFVIRGVLRNAYKNPRHPIDWFLENVDILMCPIDAEQMYFHAPRHRIDGYDYLKVQVDHMDHVQETVWRIKDMGFEADSLVERLEAEKFIYLLIFSAMTLTALAALTVAALGIANTMLLTVLQRTREIGLMKAVGARDLHVLLLFLGEGSAVGLLGGLLGLALAYGLSFPGDAWARGALAAKSPIKLETSIYLWPWWLILGTPTFSVLTATLAALYPARRAARIDPVAALRHE